ncbi:hypothetical protein CEXT_594591 [Caerostris extrusa]|uniref:Uncharacterized protein n=1 Tax=Caerostris extrusa TaxID=172846 RepID=A0AAV4R043_CAEEX|nr:hypothetical protein CEXT_594591 [Caerostris extrusa]
MWHSSNPNDYTEIITEMKGLVCKEEVVRVYKFSLNAILERKTSDLELLPLKYRNCEYNPGMEDYFLYLS